jgi:hypothetical protein
MWQVVALNRVKLVEDPETHKTVGIGLYVLYNSDINRYQDSYGFLSPFRNNLLFPFVGVEEAMKEAERLNKEKERDIRFRREFGG